VPRGLIVIAGLLLAASRGQPAFAQGPPALDREADKARRAWFAHDPNALVAGTSRVQIRLPGADPSAAIGPEQAAALLRDFMASADEVETVTRSAREVEPGRGYVELQRKYRVSGTQDVRSQTLLLGYRMGPSGWVLVELRVGG
jgi:hypothetical protein